MAFYLASQSPRRRELLRQIAVDFTTLNPDIDESHRPGERAQDYVQRLAQSKAKAGWEMAGQGDAVALGADTIVVVEGEILGKPTDFAAAEAMLTRLSDRDHQVMSAICLCSAKTSQTALSVTEVSFRAISAEEIERYWASNEPQDKAGAYAIQGLGAVFVRRINGSYSGVVGLPIESLLPLLQEFNIPYWSGVQAAGQGTMTDVLPAQKPRAEEQQKEAQ